MAINIRQKILGATDPIITQMVVATGKVEEQSDAEFIVITHEPITLQEVPTLSADNVEIQIGVIGSGADYEYKRISTTQTILVKRTYTNQVVPKGNYSITETYGLNDRVNTDSGTWYSQVADNIGHIPEENSAYWKHTPYVENISETILDAGSWNSNATYSINYKVIYNGVTWYSLTNNNTGNIPNARSPYWSTVVKNNAAPVISLSSGSAGLPIGQAVIGTSFVIG